MIGPIMMPPALTISSMSVGDFLKVAGY
jgi:hypothetical protein